MPGRNNGVTPTGSLSIDTNQADEAALLQADALVDNLQRELLRPFDRDAVPRLIKRILHEDLWRRRIVLTGSIGLVEFEWFEDFVREMPPRGLGQDPDTVKELIEHDLEALDVFDQAMQRKGGWASRRTTSNRTSSGAGATTDARFPAPFSRQGVLRRLRKDAPDLHARVLGGELAPSAAVTEANWRPRYARVPITTPEHAARILRRHFTDDQLRAIARLLLEPGIDRTR